MDDLNNSFSYRRLKPISYRTIDINSIRNNPVKLSNDWTKEEYSSLKRYFRYIHYATQKRRCAYCRRVLNPLGINEHIDHIVARSIRCGWMFKPRNLVLSCYQCNTQKSTEKALRTDRYWKRLPKKKNSYILFNPYVHNWQDHFEIEDNLFLVAKTDEGEKTIDCLKLYDYKYSLVYAEEANIFNKTAIERATKRINKYPSNTIEHKSARKLIKEIERHIV